MFELNLQLIINFFKGFKIKKQIFFILLNFYIIFNFNIKIKIFISVKFKKTK